MSDRIPTYVDQAVSLIRQGLASEAIHSINRNTPANGTLVYNALKVAANLDQEDINVLAEWFTDYENRND